MRSRITKSQSISGITLIELLAVIAIFGILTAIALPSWQDALTRYRTNSAADNLYADLNFAKAEAIKRAVPVRIIITANPPWSYCVTITDCATDVLKTATGTDFPNTTLTSTRALPLTISISPLRGTTAQTTTITFTGGSNQANVVLSSVGRIRRN